MDGENCGSNPLVACPYNPVHLMKRSRLQGHIIKCQKNFPHYAVCPFNATHRFPEQQMKEHFEKCPNKPNPETMEDTTLPEISVRSYTGSLSSVYPQSTATSSVYAPSLDKFSGNLDSIKSEVIRRLHKPTLSRPLPETDPRHECWDD